MFLFVVSFLCDSERRSWLDASLDGYLVGKFGGFISTGRLSRADVFVVWLKYLCSLSVLVAVMFDEQSICEEGTSGTA